MDRTEDLIQSFSRHSHDFGLVTSLPSKPLDGDRCTYTDSRENPTYRWDLIFNGRSQSPYKWEYTGGTPMQGAADASRSSSSTTYVAPATDPISLALPLAGDYDITIKSRLEVSGSERNV